MKRAGCIIAIAVLAALPARAADHRETARQACTGIGLTPGLANFDGCVSSLIESAAHARHREPADIHVVENPTRLDRACNAMGLSAGTRRYQSCVGNLGAALAQDNGISGR